MGLEDVNLRRVEHEHTWFIVLPILRAFGLCPFLVCKLLAGLGNNNGS